MESTEKKKTVRKSTVKPKAENSNEGTFIVKTKGYKEQFASLDAAKRAYGKLKNKKTSEGEKFKIGLLKKDKIGGIETLEEIEMSGED